MAKVFAKIGGVVSTGYTLDSTLESTLEAYAIESTGALANDQTGSEDYPAIIDTTVPIYYSDDFAAIRSRASGIIQAEMTTKGVSVSSIVFMDDRGIL